jgi:hypothetical protein
VQSLNEEFLLPGTPDDALRAFAQAASGFSGVTVRNTVPGQLIIDDVWRPVWTIVVAIVLFPIGLLALLHQRKETVVMAAVATGDETLVTLAGRCRPGLSRHLLRVVTVTEPPSS